MKKLEELNGTAVKAKYLGEDTNCILSVEEGCLYLHHNTMPDGLDEAYYERAKILTEYEKTYKSTYKSMLNQDWELINEDVGIYAFGKAKKVNLNIKEANFIQSDCGITFTAVELKKVYGSLGLGWSPDAKTINCPNLEYVGGILNITSTKEITFPNLKVIRGNLYSEHASALVMHALEVVEGDVFAKVAEKINMPMLKTVSNFKAISAKVIDLPNLKTAKQFFANIATEINMPMLETVTDFKAWSAKIVNIPNLKIAERVCVNAAAKLNMPNLKKGEVDLKK